MSGICKTFLTVSIYIYIYIRALLKMLYVMLTFGKTLALWNLVNNLHSIWLFSDAFVTIIYLFQITEWKTLIFKWAWIWKYGRIHVILLMNMMDELSDFHRSSLSSLFVTIFDLCGFLRFWSDYLDVIFRQV